MVSAFFTLALQLSVSQRYTGPALNLVRMGLVANLIAAAVVTAAQGLLAYWSEWPLWVQVSAYWAPRLQRGFTCSESR